MFGHRSRSWWILVTVAWLSSSAADVAPVNDTPNPDPKHVAVITAKNTVRVQPRNETDDFRNLQWAFDHVASGGTVSLGAGTFFLGDGKTAPRQTVIVRRGVRVVGEKQGDEWRTIVRGGGAIIEPGVGGAIESGPFRVVSNDMRPVSFERIWFREWACEVVFIEAVNGFSLRHSRISHPANRANAGVKFVHAIWTSGNKARGDFTVADNLVEMRDYTGAPADDEQLLGVFYSNHDTIRVTDNIIVGMDEGLEIIGNRNPSNGGGITTPGAHIIVTGNRMDITANPGSNWPSSYAILLAGNLHTESVDIKNNHIVTRGKGWAMGLSGNNVTLTDNRVRFAELNGVYPPGVLSLGFGGGRFEMGASLLDSVIANNTFEGTVNGKGIVFSPGTDKAPNLSRGNRIDVGASLAQLGAKPTLSIAKDMRGNRFFGDLGVIENASPPDANQLQ